MALLGLRGNGFELSKLEELCLCSFVAFKVQQAQLLVRGDCVGDVCVSCVGHV